MTPLRGIIIGALTHVHHELEAMSKKYPIAYVQAKSREQFLQDCQSEKYKDVVAAVLSYEAIPTLGPFNKEFIDKLPPKLKYISWNAAGYDPVDIDACTARGIFVSNTPSAVDNATADIAAILILSSFRNTSQFERNLREGRWRHGVPFGNDPEGKTLGILGMGGIGKALAKRMLGFDMKIQYHNRTQLDAEVENKYQASYVDFDTLLRTSDCIFISVPLNKSTYHLIDGPELAKMKDGVIIVNTSRGKVIREASLSRALETGKVAAAGLDVFEGEPDVIHPGLLSHPRCTLLPHVGTNTQETMHAMEVVCLNNFETALTKGTFINPIPEQKHLF
ncbi:hypothetical protein LRAMOSA00596 [Lichtheimia ramosa]|uniref:Glyoxylate reductase n=1 Tax=Lichtheimia ramosa TaxID=688394 RepID=A0A077W9F9_9FUNG|nr:hypothetical protein LRAMOSA00596 [Lichtheimia ramosa]